VAGASAATSLPLGGGGFYLGRVHLKEGQPEPPASSDTVGQWCGVQPGYFATMGVPLLEGRDFTARDSADSNPVVIISRSMAKEMFPEGAAVGKRIRSWRDENKYREIVGIAGDVRVFGLTETITNSVYVPHSQAPSRSMTLLVRTTSGSEVSTARIAHAIRSVDGKLPLANVRTLEEIAERDLARPRFTMLLLGLFGACAIVLAAIGIYGVMSYTVAQRTRELGIRLALGAARSDVVGSVVRQAARLSAIGVCAGLTAALLLTRLIESLLFEVSPTDPWTLGGAAVGLLGVALAAALVPARRVLLVHPAITLRCD
jgi:putative ABC transport system permease protein